MSYQNFDAIYEPSGNLPPNQWNRCADLLPPEDIEVETKIDDKDGIRNVQNLTRHRNLWFFPDLSMYIYYNPTHWRPLP